MDIRCVVCGEPWDSDGGKLDMTLWESKLFRAGAGCPGCEGEAPASGPWEPTGILDFENAGRDEGERIAAYGRALDGKAPKWERPTPAVLWTCDGCGVTVERNPDDDSLEYVLPRGAKGAQWYHSHCYDDSNATAEPAHTFGESKVCDYCRTFCDECGAPICSTLEYGDVYDEGYSHPNTDRFGASGWCTACVEKRCSECERFECKCAADEDPSEPEEDDWTTPDYVHFMVHGNPRDSFTVPDGEDWRKVLNARMDADGFYPNAWWCSDHGNWLLLDVPEDANKESAVSE